MDPIAWDLGGLDCRGDLVQKLLGTELSLKRNVVEASCDAVAILEGMDGVRHSQVAEY